MVSSMKDSNGGDDHGLEIDQFAIDRAEVVKGPAALLYGSDAIGGVLGLYTNHVPTEPFSGSVPIMCLLNRSAVVCNSSDAPTTSR